MIIPEAWSNRPDMSEELKNMYAYCNAVIEPWDGPAAVCGNFGDWIISGMDRNGLRPSRYYLTHDDRVIMASEVGVVDVASNNVKTKGRLRPGKMFLVDFNKGQLVDDNEIKNINRIIFCSGKIYYELQDRINELNLNNIYIIRLEQL